VLLMNTKRLTVSSILSALCVALMYILSLIEVLDYAAAAICGLIILFIHLELGKHYSIMAYTVVSILSLLLLPCKIAPCAFALLFGPHSLLFSTLRKIKFPFDYIIKLPVANVMFFLVFYLPTKIGGAHYDESILKEALPIIIITFALANIAFIIYDIAVKQLINKYFFKFHHRISKILK